MSFDGTEELQEEVRRLRAALEEIKEADGEGLVHDERTKCLYPAHAIAAMRLEEIDAWKRK